VSFEIEGSDNVEPICRGRHARFVVDVKTTEQRLAATLLGMTATLTVTVVGVKGRAVTFDLAGSDGVEPICRGRHGRFVIDVKTTEQRLAAKAKKAGLA
jgi:predicted thioesterase